MLDLGRSKVSSIVASSSRIAKKHLHVSVPSSIIHRAVEGEWGRLPVLSRLQIVHFRISINLLQDSIEVVSKQFDVSQL